MFDWGWIVDHIPAILYRTGQHLYLAAIAIAVGFAISFGIGVLATRRRAIYPPAVAIAGIFYTIPSLAVFAALVPITGLSILTAEVPLVMYTLVILLRNVVAGFDATPPDVVEAADGMGFRRALRLRQVELPLAVPLMVAGLRVASVSTIGLVTITGTISSAFGGLGFFIFEGYQRGFPTEIYVGAVPSILLALAADMLFVRIQRRITPWTHPPTGVTDPVAEPAT
jgi:osmoprotectant transport system permease protein